MITIRRRLNLSSPLSALPWPSFGGLLTRWAVRGLRLLGFRPAGFILKCEVRVEVIDATGKGVVCAPDEGIGAELIAAEGGREVRGALLELAELGPELEVGDVHDDVQKSDSGAGVLRDLVGKPQVSDALLLSLFIESGMILKEEDETKHRFSAY